ncbi:hypothetical protein STG2_94 [Salmonella phage STG2]|uniref:Uncharacterized protein n=2 Tax=Epseptimavirus TaxID=2732017 RepID=A0A5J6TFE3_9CAUD|nr:hypothetical protein HOU44_gp141 [Salmonella phage STG2]AYN56058.1 hypothetical protein STG2_94 [Salmonella phage STG2]QFG07442.1 hypothetical protein [Salmonella phage vB_SenS_SB10]
MLKTPVKHIWLARNRATNEFVFIDTGMTYDQRIYDLLYSVSAEEVHKLILKDAT